jgi:hypothetical protein
MGEENKQEPQEKFSEDPQKNLRIENEILKLKMQAESDAFFGGGGNLPPEVENEFLMNVQKFEDAWKDVKYVKVYELIGKPSFKEENELNDEEIKTEMEKLIAIMNEKEVFLDVLGEYEPRVIYKFITEELFEHETDDMQLPGWTKNFIYEEFHPNHEADIRKTAQDFLDDWFKKRFGEYSLEFSKQLVTADGKVFTRDEVITRLRNCLDSYTSFDNIQFAQPEVSFEWNSQESKGMGHAEGMFRYDAETESGEVIHLEGPFKFYLENNDGYWNIFYFVFPGFKW